MKKLIYIMLIASFSSVAMAQEKSKEKDERKVTAPPPVEAAFVKDFPAVKKASWEMENGNNKAEYKVNGTEQSALCYKTGHRLEVKTEIKTEELPKSVKD